MLNAVTSLTGACPELDHTLRMRYGKKAARVVASAAVYKASPRRYTLHKSGKLVRPRRHSLRNADWVGPASRMKRQYRSRPMAKLE